MTEDLRFFPRYRHEAFRKRLADIVEHRSETTTETVQQLRATSEGPRAPGEDRLAAPAVNATLVDDDALDSLRSAVRALADEHGFPDRHAAGSPRWSTFDRALARLLHSEMQIWRADAAHPEVWMHFAAWMLPDVTWWRWESPKVIDDDERAIADSPRWGGGPRWLVRGCYSRLWWRAELLGDLYLDGHLLEDAVVQIFERLSIAGCPTLVEGIRSAWTSADLPTSLDGEAVFRDFILRIRRQMGLRSIYAMDSAAVDVLCKELLHLSIDQLDRRP